jgi:hypothetical protein
MGDEKFNIPAEFVANDRAVHVANANYPGRSHEDGEWKLSYEEEFAWTMHDTELIVEWAKRNLEWNDVRKKAVRVSDFIPNQNYNRLWNTARFKIIDVDDGTIS